MVGRINNVKKGNVMLMLLPIALLLLIVLIIATIFVLVQLSVQILEIKSNIFYLVHSSIGGENVESLSYNNYSLNTGDIKLQLDKLLKTNYLKKGSENVGVIDIKCKNVQVISNKEYVKEHTKNKYILPVICTEIEIVFTPIIKILGENININIHDDVKLSLLEFV